MVLSYLAMIYLARTRGIEELGDYVFVLNAVTVVGVLSSIGLPDLVQRLGARMTAAQIGAATVQLVRQRWHWAALIAIASSGLIIVFDQDQLFTAVSWTRLSMAGLGFALSLTLVETMRVAQGARHAEVQRNVVRPTLTLVVLALGLSAGLAVIVGVLGAVAIASVALIASQAGSLSSADKEVLDTGYIAERSRDIRMVAGLGAIGLVFSSMDLIVFALINDKHDTGIYGAASRFAMLINIALLAGNAQMIRHIARYAEGGFGDVVSLAALRRHVLMVRVATSVLFVGLVFSLPLYAWIMSIPAARLWPYFVVIAVSFWIQGMLGPVESLMVHSHQVTHLFWYNFSGMIVFCLLIVVLQLSHFELAIPIAAAVATNMVKMLSWNRIYKTQGVTV